MNNNLRICSNATGSLKRIDAASLNESAGQHGYFLEGVFAELDKKNRNDRIYTKDEYLKHLQYLRNDIQSGESLLGELDHPDDRFEVKMKEASHRIVDLWYDSNKNVVMGKIQLLDTPNGKLAQSMVDQGIPLHISSRAAGSVNDDHTVSIQQIYTYDLVAKPGFASAVLHRVDESAGDNKYTPDIRKKLDHMMKTESMNAAPMYGIINEDVCVSEMSAPAVLRKEAREIQINREIESNNNMSELLKEDDNPVASPLKFGNANIDSLLKTETKNVDGGDDNAPKEEHSKSDSENDGEESKPEADKAKDDTKDEKDKDNGVKIISVEGVDDVQIKGVDADHKEAPSDNEDGDGDKGNNDENATDEKRSTEADDTKDIICDDKDDPSDEEKAAADKKAEEEIKTIEDKMEKFNKDFEELTKAIKNKNGKENDKESGKDAESSSECCSSSKNEAVLSQYPVSMMMTEKNFAAFSALSESQKNKVVAYLQNTNSTTREAINENWKNGINYVEETPVWLKFAPARYKELYESASQDFKKNLAMTAQYFMFESQSDINDFWENSGLEDYTERRLLNESFVKNMPKVAAPQKETNLPYSSDYIQMIADMASEYNG